MTVHGAGLRSWRSWGRTAPRVRQDPITGQEAFVGSRLHAGHRGDLPREGARGDAAPDV